MLGYCGTDKPYDLEEYSFKKLCDDLTVLLDMIGVYTAVSAGLVAVIMSSRLWKAEPDGRLSAMTMPMLKSNAEVSSVLNSVTAAC